MRDAQSGFDQVISFAGSKIKKEDVEMALGVAGADTLIRVINGIAEHQPSEALAVVEDVVMRGHDLRNFCRDLLAHFRDLLVTKVSGSEELLESAVCDRDELKRQAQLFSESDLVRFFHSLAETETLLKTAVHPRYQLEVGLVKLMEMRRLEPLSNLIERLGALEESVRTGKPLSQSKSATASPPVSRGMSANVGKGTTSVTSSANAGAAVKPALETEPRAFAASPAPTPAMSAAEPEAVADDSEIGRIKSALEKRRKMFLVTLLEGAAQASIVDDELCVEFAPEGKSMRDTLAKSDNVKVLREVCKEVTGSDVGVRFVILDPQASNDPAVSKQDTDRREKQSLRETAEKDPVVQQMLRTFRGEIVDVRRVDRE
jgi:DNA polymerase-3 subunit gamma/tau